MLQAQPRHRAPPWAGRGKSWESFVWDDLGVQSINLPCLWLPCRNSPEHHGPTFLSPRPLPARSGPHCIPQRHDERESQPLVSASGPPGTPGSFWGEGRRDGCPSWNTGHAGADRLRPLALMLVGGEQVSGGLRGGQAAVHEAESHEVGPAPSPETDAKPVIPREGSAVASREERVRCHREFGKGAKTKKWTWFISCSLWQESCQHPPPHRPHDKVGEQTVVLRQESRPDASPLGCTCRALLAPFLVSCHTWAPGLWTSIMNRVKLLVTSF